MSIELISKISPKNDGFTGMVDADQILGGGAFGTLPDVCLAASNITQHQASITGLGTIASGTWSADSIADNKIVSALTGKTYNGLTLTSVVTGFTIAGGTTPKTLTLDDDFVVSTQLSAIGANTGKDTNVSTNLSEGTSTETTVDVNSSDGSNATLVSASTIRAGLLTKAKWDEIVANSLKDTDVDHNVSTTLEVGTNNTTELSITSDGGADDITLPVATTAVTGVINSAMFDALHAAGTDPNDHAQNADTALGAQTENLDMNTHKIIGVTDPTANQEAATKKYVDDNAGGAATGTIMAWGGADASPPTGYLECDGAAVSRSTYIALYGIVGTMFGVGNGTTTFNLPNLQAKFPRGSVNGVNPGGTGGATCHTHGISHCHTLAGVFTDDSCYNCIWGQGTDVLHEASCRTGTNLNLIANRDRCKVHRHTFSSWASTGLSSIGNTTPCSNIPPYQDVIWIIKT